MDYKCGDNTHPSRGWKRVHELNKKEKENRSIVAIHLLMKMNWYYQRYTNKESHIRLLLHHVHRPNILYVQNEHLFVLVIACSIRQMAYLYIFNWGQALTTKRIKVSALRRSLSTISAVHGGPTAFTLGKCFLDTVAEVPACSAASARWETPIRFWTASLSVMRTWRRFPRRPQSL